jgi:hypothetical protein
MICVTVIDDSCHQKIFLVLEIADEPGGSARRIRGRYYSQPPVKPSDSSGLRVPCTVIDDTCHHKMFLGRGFLRGCRLVLEE